MTTGLLLQSWDAHFQVQSSERQRQRRQGKDTHKIQAKEREEKIRKDERKENRTDEKRIDNNRRKQNTTQHNKVR
jgi:hypothetical protein